MQDETGYENETRGTAEVRKNEKKTKNGTYSLYGENSDHLCRHDHSRRIMERARKVVAIAHSVVKGYHCTEQDGESLRSHPV
jgi:hypothetical protein